MSYPIPIVFDWLRELLWPLCRISAMIMVMTTISGSPVPNRVRLLLSVLITAAVAPLLPKPPAIELFSIAAMLIVAQQLLIGITVGFVSLMVIQTFVLAGQIIGMQTSLGFASLVDPTSGQQVPLVGQFYLLLMTLIFFTVNGHLLMITMIVESFYTLPIGESLEPQSLKQMADFGGKIFANALTMSLSAVTALLLINFSFGVMTRAAPQLNIFAIGFPITMLSGLLILWLTLDGVVPHFFRTWDAGQVIICDLLRLSCQV